MTGYCTFVLYFHSPAACENTATHSCNIQPYYFLSHQIKCIYILALTSGYTYYARNHADIIGAGLTGITCYMLTIDTSLHPKWKGKVMLRKATKVHVCPMF